MLEDGSSAPAQPLRALERANEVRLARAELKRQIAGGTRSVADVVIERPWEAAGMTVSDLLTSQRRWGRARCRRLLLPLNLGEAKRLRELTDRQRIGLIAGLDEICAPAPRQREPILV